MKSLRFKITAREKEHDFMISDRGDFTLEEGVACDERMVLDNPCCTLYALDLEKGEACFVETPAAVDLTAAPFYFLGQFQNATHLVSISFDTFHELAEEIVVDDERLAFVHSVGRCGSTLVSKAFAAVPEICSVSEPDTLTQLVSFRSEGRMDEVQLERFARDCIRFACKPLAGAGDYTFWAIKFRSQCMEICDVLCQAFPRAKNLYLTREPVSWLESAYRAFVDPTVVEQEEVKQWYEDIFAGMYALVRELRVEGKPMPVWKVWLLNWIANVETKGRLAAAGISFCEADFSEIKRTPEEVVHRIFAACGLEIRDWSGVEAVLARDSQLGSSIARSEINDLSKHLPEANRLAAIHLLQARGHLATGV